jgi:DNA-binding transcriptional regulator YiaG
MSGSRTSCALGLLLRDYRRWDGYSRTALAEQLGVALDELERWEILGVPIPLPNEFVLVAEAVGMSGYAFDAVLSGEERRLPRDPIEVYEAEPVIENAIADHGWTPEEIADALATSPTKVQAWRLGVVEMTSAERRMLSGLIRLRNEPAAEER